MTSYCDVTNSVYPVTMTTISHCSILEFGRGHPIKQSPRGSADLCTPLAVGYAKDGYWSEVPDTIFGQKFSSARNQSFFRSIFCCLYKTFSTYCTVFL